MSVQSQLERFINDKSLQPYPVWEYSFSEPETIEFSEEVRKACEVNLCGNYGKTWACPPGVGDWQDLKKEFLEKYSRVLVFTTKHDIEDSLDFEGMWEARLVHNQLEAAILKLIKDESEAYTILGTEGCNLCEKCTYPDAPCRHPDKSNRSMESTGMSVVAYARDHGMHYINGINTVTYFTAVLYN